MYYISHFTSRAKAMTPDTSGEEALVPVKLRTHSSLTNVVTYNDAMEYSLKTIIRCFNSCLSIHQPRKYFLLLVNDVLFMFEEHFSLKYHL